MKRLLLLGLATLFTAAAPAPGIAQRALKIGVSGGATLPVARFGDFNDSGFNFGAHALISSRFLPQDFKIELQHNRMKLKGSDSNTMITSATVNLELNPGSAIARIAPYLSLGIGGYYVKSLLRRPPPTLTEYDNTTKFGLNAGGGFRFPLGPLNAFVEARYHRLHSDLFTSGSITYVPIVLGVTF